MKTFNQYHSHQQLVESINENNDTGFSAEDIACIIETHYSDEWSEAITCESAISNIDNWLNEEHSNAAESK